MKNRQEVLRHRQRQESPRTIIFTPMPIGLQHTQERFKHQAVAPITTEFIHLDILHTMVSTQNIMEIPGPFQHLQALIHSMKVAKKVRLHLHYHRELEYPLQLR